MLERVELTNFRGFERHTLSFRPLTVMVGQNNAGKSSIVEALRLISVVTERTGGLNFHDPPYWSGLPKRMRGVRPSVDGLGIEFLSICHRYQDPPASVCATFGSGERVEVYANAEGEAFAVLFEADGSPILSKGRMTRVEFPKLHILPQVAPLESRETILSEDHVRRHLSSPLSPRHFRNQLRLLPGAYRGFRELAEQTWQGLQIRTLDGARGFHGGELFLAVRDRDFVAEVGQMGHGLQMWLQVLWFLSRTPADASVVLDEPDVYMHPDLQRRLIRLVGQRFSQVVIATHSVEIMAEVEPAQILIIDRSREQSEFANSDPDVQRLIERLGGVHNLQLARLWNSKRCLFVEGKDLQYLKLVHDLLFPQALLPLDDLPNSSIGGWGGWHYAVGSSIFVRNSVGEDISVFCVLDSDYHTTEAVRTRMEEANRRNVRLHIWRRKEIENYFLIPATVARAINAGGVRGDLPVNEEDVSEKLHAFAESLRQETIDNYADEIFLENRARGTKSANRHARVLVNGAFTTREGALGIVSGKAVLGMLAGWTEAEFGVSIGVATICRTMTVGEVPDEVRKVVVAIHEDGPFAGGQWERV